MLRSLQFLPILAIIFVFAKSTFAQPVVIAFPLPWRYQRLIADARNPQTPLSDIRAMLKDTDASVRLEAVRTLGQRGSQNDLPELEKLALGSDAIAAAAKVAAAWITGRMYPGEKPKVKLSVFLQSNNPREQLEAVLALGEIGANDVLEQYVREGEDPYNLLRAILLLQNNDRKLSESAFERLQDKNTMRYLGGTGRERVSSKDIDKLKSLYLKSRVDNLSLQQLIDVLTHRSTSETPVAQYVIDRLASMDGDAIKPLMRIITNKTNSLLTRQFALSALMKIKSDLIEDDLKTLLNKNESSPEFTKSIFHALAYRKSPIAITYYTKILSDENSTITNRVDALWTLKSMADSGLDKELIESIILPILNYADFKKGSFVASDVARIVGSDKSIDPLIKIVNTGSAPDESRLKMLRNSAITTLGFVGSRVTDSKTRQKVLFFLIHQCYDENPVTRIVAVQALARMAGAEGIPVIVDMAKKEKDGAAMRFEVSGIYKAGGPEAVTALEQLRQFAIDNKNDQMQELCEEGLLRLKREGRDKEVKPVTYPGDSGGLLE